MLELTSSYNELSSLPSNYINWKSVSRKILGRPPYWRKNPSEQCLTNKMRDMQYKSLVLFKINFMYQFPSKITRELWEKPSSTTINIRTTLTFFYTKFIWTQVFFYNLNSREKFEPRPGFESRIFLSKTPSWSEPSWWSQLFLLL